MRDEYDFPQGERGKFFNKDAEIFSFVQQISERRKTDVSSIVNQILRSDMQLAEVIK